MLQVRHLLADKGNQTHAIGPDESILNAASIMTDHHIGSLLVMRGNELLGIVSERDYMHKVILKGCSPNDTPVRDIMSTPVLTVTPDDTVETCMHLCTDRRMRHLPVIEKNKVIGIVSIGDLVKAVISEQGEQIEYLQRYIAG
ncbi:MAG: CBS domain-containing protein [Rhodanobacter sp.]|jgi:CBS domain-containing protein|nr:CBS domain-containing protein [Rhodanobacter sp.]